MKPEETKSIQGNAGTSDALGCMSYRFSGQADGDPWMVLWSFKGTLCRVGQTGTSRDNPAAKSLSVFECLETCDVSSGLMVSDGPLRCPDVLNKIPLTFLQALRAGTRHPRVALNICRSQMSGALSACPLQPNKITGVRTKMKPLPVCPAAVYYTT